MSIDSCHNSSRQHVSQTNIKINLSFLPKHLFWYKDTRTLFFWNYKSQSQSSYQTGSLRRSTAIRRKKFIKVWDYLFILLSAQCIECILHDLINTCRASRGPQTLWSRKHRENWSISIIIYIIWNLFLPITTFI